jgi:SAM-dependent methyltransferase
MSDSALVESMQRFYDAVARRSPGLAFLNYGFVDDPAAAPAGEPDLIAMCRRLYEVVLLPFPEGATRAVEVACGRGGGARFLLEGHPELEYVGLDLSAEHVGLSRSRVGPRAATHFAMADAALLPVATASADVVFSIEAAQHFERPERFYSEAARVLRPGGWFLLAALWPPAILPDAFFATCGLRIVERRDITANVVSSLDRTSALRKEMVETLDLPERFRPLLLSWAGVQGTPSYDNLATGATRYVSYRLQRE